MQTSVLQRCRYVASVWLSGQGHTGGCAAAAVWSGRPGGRGRRSVQLQQPCHSQRMHGAGHGSQRGLKTAPAGVGAGKDGEPGSTLTIGAMTKIIRIEPMTPS